MPLSHGGAIGALGGCAVICIRSATKATRIRSVYARTSAVGWRPFCLDPARRYVDGCSEIAGGARARAGHAVGGDGHAALDSNRVAVVVGAHARRRAPAHLRDVLVSGRRSATR